MEAKSAENIDEATEDGEAKTNDSDSGQAAEEESKEQSDESSNIDDVDKKNK